MKHASMQTYIFSELSERGQEAAVNRYQEEQIVQEAANEMIDNDILIDIPTLFDSLGWRFTEHGERIG